jgi:ribosomal protein S10
MHFGHNFSFHKIKKLQIGINIESHLKLPQIKTLLLSSTNPLQEGSNLRLDIKCVSLKRKNKILLTTLTSPHVHKKSREQYKINYYKTYLLCNIENLKDYKKFLKFKNLLYELQIEQGLHIYFTFFKNFNIQGFLPHYEK